MASNTGKSWTAELNASLLSLKRQGSTNSAVADKLGRSEMSIRLQLEKLMDETITHNKYILLDNEEIENFINDVRLGKSTTQLVYIYELPAYQVKEYKITYAKEIKSALADPVRLEDWYLTIVSTQASNNYIRKVIEERQRRGITDLYGYAINPLINAFEYAKIHYDVRALDARVREELWQDIVEDIFCDEINNINQPNETTEPEEPKMKLFKIETVIEIDGVKVFTLSDDKLIEFISQIEEQINKLSNIETNSLAIDDKIEQLNNNAFQLAKILDSRIK
jgi:hypothetical protein